MDQTQSDIKIAIDETYEYAHQDIIKLVNWIKANLDTRPELLESLVIPKTDLNMPEELKQIYYLSYNFFIKK
jgi:hypothetical protein